MMRRWIARPLWFALSMLLATSLMLGTGQAQTKIKLLVNGQPVTNYDINQRAKLLRMVGETRGNATRAAEDELIDEVLQALEARRFGISVSDEQADAAYLSIAQRNKIPLSALNQAVQARGVRVSTFKRRLRAQLLWRQVVSAKTRGSARIFDQDVLAELRTRSDEFDQTTFQYELVQIMLVVPESGPNSNENRRRREAEKLRKEFKSCDTGMELVKKIPEVVVRPVGVRTSAELAGPFAELLAETPEGQLTKPQRNRTSLDVYAVCKRVELASTAAAEAKLKLELQEAANEMQLRRFAHELRRSAIIEYK